jgi:hypothetical protein
MRSSDDEITVTCAPSIFAKATANSATPPQPCTSTRSPGRVFEVVTSALQAVSAAHGKVAASMSLRWAGSLDTPSSDRHMKSAIVPSIGPPSDCVRRSRSGSPLTQR